MKKKMGILAGLTMAVVVTAYSVSGTYAKYTSSIDLADEARVAKWQLIAKDAKTKEHIEELNLFADSYSVNEKGLYVKSIDGKNVVAPGTKGEYQVNLSGAMETRYTVQITFDEVNGNEPVVKYDVDANGKVTVNPEGGAYEYRPIKYTVFFYRGMNGDTDNLKAQEYFRVNGSLADVKAGLATANASAYEFEPHRMGESIVVEWSWDTRNTVEYETGKFLAPEEVDVLDTYLGENWYKIDEADNEYALGQTFAKYKLGITATQVAEDHATNKDTTRLENYNKYGYTE